LKVGGEVPVHEAVGGGGDGVREEHAGGHFGGDVEGGEAGEVVCWGGG
jgi:hypothetical protein